MLIFRQGVPVLVAVFFSSITAAQASAPDVVGDYVAFCKVDTNFDDCHSEIVRIAFANATEVAARVRGEGGAKDKRRICSMQPGGPDEWKTELKNIVDWLSQHAETHQLKIDDGINRAFGAIWNDCH